MSTDRSRKHAGPLIESLETRTLMSVTYGTNLIVNPGAETFTGKPTAYNHIVPTGWTASGDPTVVLYSTGSGFPGKTSPGPASRGKAFFSGGPDKAVTNFLQTINLTSIAAAIDAGKVKLALSGYLGGYLSQRDNVTLTVNFENAAKKVISHVSVGPVTPANRHNITGMLSRATTGKVPVGARYAQIQLHFTRTDGDYNDGYADNLSLVLTKTA